MSRRDRDGQATRDWMSSAGGGLHRGGTRTAEPVGAQFRPAAPARRAAAVPPPAPDARRFVAPGEPMRRAGGEAPAPVSPQAEAAEAAALAGRRIDGKILNVRPDPVDFRDVAYRPSLVKLATRQVPAQLSVLGLSVRNQGNEGSCTGQALAAVVDLQNIERVQEGASVPRRVSARMLYESARVFDEYADDELPGSSVRGAIKGFFHRGVCGADLAPYFPGDVRWRLGVERAKAARSVTLGAYFRLRHVLNDYHAALAEVGALLCSAMVHDGWSAEAVRAAGGEIHSPGGDPKRVELTGAHAFALAGFVPEGFLVLNSWGEAWGGYAPPLKDGSRGDPLQGIALWPYDEWCEHVLDAWVLRLQVAANLPSGFTGGYHLVRRPTGTQQDPLRRGDPASVASVPTREIAGHFVNISNGAFVAAPPYENDAETFEETAQHLAANEAADPAKRYDHLLFYAHGGLNEEDEAAARAAAMTPIFKQNRIYPIFFLWHTGFGETASDLLRRLFEGARARAGGFGDFSDVLLENSARPFGRPIWQEMKADARRCFARPDGEPVGDGWLAVQPLLAAARARARHPLRIHLVGHSAGAIFLGEMLARARQEGMPLDAEVATASLFAPACTNDFFADKLAPLGRALQGSAREMSVYHLTRADELGDNVAGMYRKSLLHLVSNAFEDRTATPIAGMEVFRQAWPGVRYVASDPKAPRMQRLPSRAATHGGFDNDDATMNHVLARILGREGITEREGGFSEADLVGHGF